MKRTLVLIILLIILLSACNKKSGEVQQQPESKKYVANSTINFNEKLPLKVRFTKIIPEEIRKDDKKLEKCFSFNKRIDFSVKALNDYEVEITVHSGRNLSRINTLYVDNNKLFKMSDQEQAAISVKLLRNQVTVIEPEFENLGKSSVFKALVEFKQQVAVEDLKKSVVVKLDNKDLSFTVGDITGKPRQYVIESIAFNKTKKNQIVSLEITDEYIPLEIEISKEYNIASLHSMQVLNVYTKLVESRGTVEVLFSEVLDFDQKIDGYVSLKQDKKDINVTVVKQSDRIILTGDLLSGKVYELFLKKGIRNKHGNILEKDYKESVEISDVSPHMAFAESSNIYTTRGNNKIRIRSVNYKSVFVEVIKIEEENIGHFIQEEGFKPYRWGINNSYFSRKTLEQKFEINSKKNKWVETDLDLSKIVGENKKGMFAINISGRDNLSSTNHNPTQDNDTKTIIITDLGMTYKRESGDKHKVIVTNLLTGKPEDGCQVKVFDRQNIVLASGVSNSMGMFEFKLEGKEYESSYERYVRVITAENRNSVSVLYPDHMQWNTSTFDVGGVEENKAGNSFVYTERGVYRPGDEINFSLILRSGDGTFPTDQPVNVEIYNPKGTKKVSKTLKTGKDGFYSFAYSTTRDDQTGTWLLKYSSAGISGSHSFKVETVVAERLKVELETNDDVISKNDRTFAVKVNSQYLFGAPASNLRYKLSAEISKMSKEVKTLPGYLFDDVTTSFKKQNSTIGKGKLDKDGHKTVSWKIPDFSSASTSLVAKLTGEVIDNGGRASKAVSYVDIDPYKYYVGVKLADDMHIRRTNKVKVVLIDAAGKLVPGENLTLNIYRKSRYWWYERGRTNRNSYKANKEVSLVYSRNLKTTTEPLEVDVDISTWGEYLIEVTHNISKGHTAARYFYPYWYGSKKNGAMDDGILALKTDKKTYKSGEEVRVQFDAPENSVVLVGLESKGKMLKTYWDAPSIKNGKGEISFRVDDTMIPNGYCTVSVIQPVENENDLPVRTYGVIPISVFDEKTRNKITISSAKSFKSNKKFKVELQTDRKQKSQVTIAVVDEGLLSLTNFRSPDPWNYFYRKIMHSVKSYDNYGFVSGIAKGDPYKSFLVGGDLEARGAGLAKDLRKRKELNDLLEQKDRFKPVCMFSGILETDENGHLVHEFTMPEYIGAVRIMAVLVDGESYDSAEKTVPVKEDLMVKATLPRFLNMNNKFTIPVEVFKDKDITDIDEVLVSVDAGERIKLSAGNKRSVKLDKNGQAVVKFDAVSDSITGNSHVTVKAVSGKYSAESNTDMSIYSPNPSILKSENKKLKKGTSVEFTIPDDGYSGSMEAIVSVSTLENLDVSKRIKWLIKYPYGCIEQTTSSVFPQLYLSEFVKTDSYNTKQIDRNINSAISRLKRFQVPSGGLSYWPGSRNASGWGTMYAGHFLLEAKKRGYYVPQELLNTVITYLQKGTRRFIAADKNHYNTRYQVMKLYLLTLAEKPEVSSMNIIYESYMGHLNRTYKLLLAAAYSRIGDKKTSDIILTRLDEKIEIQDSKHYYRYSWGSDLRDQGLSLLALTDLDSDEAYVMFDTIAGKLKEKTWYSTQSLGYSLTALGNYYVKNEDMFTVDKSLSCYVEFADKSKKKLKVEGRTSIMDLSGHFGEKIKVHFEDSEKLKTVFATLDWSGVVKDENVENISDRMTIKRKWKNSSGTYINPGTIQQGDVVTCEITVGIQSDFSKDNIALVQALPAGWEIENERLTGKKSNRRKNYDYMDIRDDKIMWFFGFDYRRSAIKTFTFKVRAVTCGEFTLPPTYVEAMYDNRFKAVLKGIPVTVTEKK